MKGHALFQKKPSGTAGDESNWRLHVLPRFKGKKVVDVTEADVQQLRVEMASTPYQANRVVAMLSKAVNLSEVWGLRPDGSNPCRHVARFREQRRERYPTPSELARLADVLCTSEREQSGSPEVVAAARFLVFTGCPVREILDLAGQKSILRPSVCGSETAR